MFEILFIFVTDVLDKFRVGGQGKLKIHAPRFSVSLGVVDRDLKSDAPAKFIFDDQGRSGQATDSIVAGGTILSGGMVRNSVLGRGVRVHSGALVEDSILFDNGDIGRRARVRRAILDKNVRVPEDALIGYDLEHDRKLHHVTDSGIVVIEGHRSTVDVATRLV